MSELLAFPRPGWFRRVVNFCVGLFTFSCGVACLAVSVMAAVGTMGFADLGSTSISVAGFCLALGLLFFWVTWIIRVYVLPFQFVVDAVRRECAYRWGNWTTARTHIPETTKFSGQLSLVGKGQLGGIWKWSIDAIETATGNRRRIFSAPKEYWDKESGLADCQGCVESLARHLSLPWEVLSHSEKTTSWG